MQETHSPILVIIIGLGASGLNAAKTLLEKNSKLNILALEASDRVGGRVHTHRLKNESGSELPLELGANWLHEYGYCESDNSSNLYATPIPNPLIELVEKYKLDHQKITHSHNVVLDIDNNIISDLDSRTNQNSSNQYVAWQSKLDKTFELYNHRLDLIKKQVSFYNNCNDVLDSNSSKSLENLSEQDVLNQVGFNIKNSDFNNKLGLTEYDLADQYTLGMNGGVASNRASAWLNIIHNIYSGEEYIVTGGYDKILQSLYNDLIEKYHNRFKVIFNAEVYNINQTSEALSSSDISSLVKIKYKNKIKSKNTVADADFDSNYVNADYVIATFPIGVLKKDIETNAGLFSPKNPTQYDVIKNKVDIGLMNKVFLHFDKPFWRRDFEQPEYIYLLKELSDRVTSKQCPVSIVDYSSLHRSSDLDINTLMVSFYGAEAKFDSDSQAYNKACTILSSAFGDKYIAPISYNITNWHKETNFLSSWPVPNIYFSPNDIAALKQPLDRVFFAGDICASDTVHHALSTGQFAAEQLLNSI